LENERKTQIIKAAVKRFSKHGPGKTTLDEIARDLRIGKATIYHYFKSKEELYFRSVEWECDQFIEETKLIFEDNELDLRGMFNSYFSSKETIDQRYKLLYELLLILMKDEGFDEEMEILRSTLRKEEMILEMVLSPAFRNRNLKPVPSLAGMLVLSSWGWLLGMKLKGVSDFDDGLDSKDSLNVLIDNILPD
jgi:AcrR family transcriptional regulator